MKKIIFIFIGWFIFWITNAQNIIPVTKISGISTKTDSAFSFEGLYLADVCHNFTGGIKTGSVYLGMANICLGFNTQNAGWWQGGEFFIKGAHIHGNSPSEKLAGDFQVVSNIDAGEHTYIQELWYKQTLDNIELTVGVQDLNAQFIAIESGGLYLNSSFGIPSVASDNVPISVFPLTVPAVMGKWTINDKMVWQNGVFDGKPTNFEDNRYNVNYQLSNDDGALVISEWQLTWLKYLPNTLKVGGYYHTGLREENEITGTKETTFDNNWGLYCLMEHTVWKQADTNRKLNLFGQAVFSPTKYNHHHWYLGGGMNFSGIFASCSDDVLGLAVAHAGFNHPNKKNETIIELSYQKMLGDHFFIQPDVQYIINPAGTDENLDNALIAIVRMGLNF
jgi:porin